MPNHFEPVVMAVNRLLMAVRNATHGTGARRTEDQRNVRNALEGVRSAADRAIAVGFPNAPDKYKDGEAGWKYDLDYFLKQIKRAGDELVTHAATVPASPRFDHTPRDAQEYQRRLAAQNAAAKELQTFRD